ncbi:SH3 domain-containing protein [Acidovorax sp.]|uniref:SH3 domain-containing protein n=1 Tax=Acidovorax sp. TaxID=1872122 RepID=UPI003D0099C2
MRLRSVCSVALGLAGSALWVHGAAAQQTAPEVRHVQGSWVNLREAPRADARVLAQVPANTVLQQLAERDGWCEVSYRGDPRLNAGGKGALASPLPLQAHVACNLLAPAPLALVQAAKDPARAFWVAPSPKRLRAYGNALPRPAALQMPALIKTHALGAEVRYPARPEFEAAKRLLRAGVLLDPANEIARGKPVDPVADISIPGVRLALKPIAPSRFKRHGEVALLHETEADGLAAVAGSRLAVVPTDVPMGGHNRHNGPEIEFVTGFWDVGAAYLVFDPPLTIYAITHQGLVGAQGLRKRTWMIDNGDFYCGGHYTGPGFEDPPAGGGDELVNVKGYARLSDTAQVLTRLVTATALPASAVAVQARRHPKEWTIAASPPEVPQPVRIQTAVVAYEIDLDRDGIADILRIEIPSKGEMSGHPVFTHHWYLNVDGQWFRAGQWVDQECT